jgi:hypothetical protein
MRHFEHAMRFCKLSSGKSENKIKGEAQFPFNFGLVVDKFSMMARSSR